MGQKHMNQFKVSHAKILLASALIFNAAAMSSSMPDDSAINKESAKVIKKSAAAIEKAELQSKVLNQAIPDVGNIQTTPMPDPSLIAKKYQTIQKTSEPALYVMVSFSMPEASIARLGEQAARAGATLVLRGMISDSMQKTAQKTADFIKRYPGLQFQIDPTLYRRYAVTQVPTFVIVKDSEEKTCTKECDSTNYFVSVSGDVTLDYALDYLSRRSGERFAPIAEMKLKKVRGEQ